MTLGTHIFVSLHLNNLLKRHIPKYDEQDIQDRLYADGLELRHNRPGACRIASTTP